MAFAAAIPIIASVISAAGSAYSANQAQSGASGANQRNYDMWREYRDWSTHMSNTEVQRRVADLQAAGMNPMLGYQGSASTPSAPPPRAESETAQSSVLRSQMAQQLATTALTAAQARKTNAEAEITENEASYSAFSAGEKADQLQQQGHILAEQLQKVAAERYSAESKSRQEEVTERELQPLMIGYQRYLNKASQLGLSEKEADAKFWEKFEDAKWLGPAKDVMQMIKSLMR